MRREGLRLRQAVSRIRRAMHWHYGLLTVPFHMQEAASTYYLMRERLLALYEVSHAARHAHLLLLLGDGVPARQG